MSREPRENIPMSTPKLQWAYALSKPTDDGDEVWIAPERMTLDQLHQALAVILEERADLADRYYALAEFGRARFGEEADRF